MKHLNLKKLVLSAAIIGTGTFGFSAVADNTGSSLNRDSQPSQSVTVPGPADRNVTNPNYSDRNSVSSSEQNTMSGADRNRATGPAGVSGSDRPGSMTGSTSNSVSGSAATTAEIDGTVHFEANSVSLTESAQRQLKQVVDQLDKSTPVALTVEMQGSFGDGSSVSSQQSSSATLGQESSAGLPMDERGVAGAGISPAERNSTGIPGNTASPSTNAEAVEREQEDRAQLISRYRAESIRQYLERQGIEVVEWNMEGGVTSAAGGTTADNGFASSNPSAQQNAEEIQQVRIVVIGDVRPEGLSAL